MARELNKKMNDWTELKSESKQPETNRHVRDEVSLEKHNSNNGMRTRWEIDKDDDKKKRR